MDNTFTKSNCDFAIEGLESLQSIQPEWSEEDEKNSAFIVAALDAYSRLRKEKNNTSGQEDFDKAISWIHNRLGFIHPQSKQKWNEKDKKILQSLHHVMNCADAQNVVKRDGLSVADVCNFLFSIEPNWKPSEEQIEALKRGIEDLRFCSIGKERLPIIQSLLNDLLKKL